jgi:site-specific DNA-methyltransferase (adenine-specific)
MIDLRLGRWQDALLDITADSLITDAPFSYVTHKGYRNGNLDEGVSYPPLTREDACELALSWSERVRRWVFIFGDHVSREWHREAWACFPEWYVFNAPVVWVQKGSPPRVRGDGPASSCAFITVARRRGKDTCDGARPGFYEAKTVRKAGLVGAKDIATMRKIITHYSRPGDLVVDPYAGSGRTLVAAHLEGRSAVGAEVLPKHHEIARALVDAPERKAA